MRFQKTLKASARFSGKCLFSGEDTGVTINPAEPGSGIVFVRSDLPGKPEIQLNPQTLTERYRRTAVVSKLGEVECIEHLLSAIHGLGIDNVAIELSGKEIPIMDGSSKPIVEEILRVGLVEQSEYKKVISIPEAVSVAEQASSVVALPNEGGFVVSFSIQYDNTIIGNQHYSLEVKEEKYVSEIAPARTYALKSEAEMLLARGFVQGGSTENAIIVDENTILNNTLRYPDEFVRHKILDLIGDLAALGGVLRGHIIGWKSGHAENIRLVKRISQMIERKAESTKQPLIDIREIIKILPHRYPMLLIDRVIEIDGYRRAVGIKNVTINEPFFIGHYPGQPIMPGVLLIEAMAQLAGVLLMRRGDTGKKLPVLLSLENVKLRKTVTPGDQLRIEVETIKLKQRTAEVMGKIMVEDQVASEALMKFLVLEEPA